MADNEEGGESETSEELDEPLEDIELDVEDAMAMEVDGASTAEQNPQCWIVAHRRDDPTREVAAQENSPGEAAQQNPASEVTAQQNPTSEVVAQQNPACEVAAQQNPAGEVAAQQNPAGEVAAQQNPAGEVAAQQNPQHMSKCADLASLDPREPTAPRLL